MNLNPFKRFFAQAPTEGSTATTAETKTTATTTTATTKTAETTKTADTKTTTTSETKTTDVSKLAELDVHKFYIAVLGRVADNTGYSYWSEATAAKESKSIYQVALSSFLQSKEGASGISTLSNLKKASATSITKLAGDKQVEAFVKNILQNIGGKDLANKENIDKYKAGFKSALTVEGTVTRKDVEAKKNAIYDKLVEQVKKVIDDNSADSVFNNRIELSKESVSLMNSVKAFFPNISTQSGEVLFTKKFADLTSKVDNSKVTFIQAKAGIIQELNSNKQLSKALEIKTYLDNAEKNGQRLTAGDGDDNFEVNGSFPTTTQDDRAWLEAVDAGGGKDTLTVNVVLSEDEAKIFKNFENIVFNNTASRNLDLNKFTDKQASFFVEGTSVVTALKGEEKKDIVTNLTYKKGGATDTLTIRDGGNPDSKSKVVLTVEDRIQEIDASAVADNLTIKSGKKSNIQTLTLGNKGGNVSFEGDKEIKVGAISGATGIDASKLKGALSINIDSNTSPKIANSVIIGGDGDDTLNLTIRNSDASDTGSGVFIVSGDGSDKVTVTLSGNKAAANINTGDGNDVIKLSVDNKDAKATVDAGAGDDVIIIDATGNASSQALTNIKVDGGAGNDTFVIGSHIAATQIGSTSKLRENYNIEIINYSEGEAIKLSSALSESFDTSAVQKYLNGSDTYLAIGSTSAGNQSGLVIKLTGFQGTVSDITLYSES